MVNDERDGITLFFVSIKNNMAYSFNSSGSSSSSSSGSKVGNNLNKI